MKKTHFEKLREQAESKLRQKPTKEEGYELTEMKTLVHELQTYKVELDLQNESLMESQRELQAARDGFAYLFENAPVGYIILDKHGVIVKSNTTFANMLGVSLPSLHDKPISKYIDQKSKQEFHSRYRGFFSSPTSKILELYFQGADSKIFTQLQGKTEPAFLRYGEFEAKHEERLLVTVVDISDRKRSEEMLKSIVDATVGWSGQQALDVITNRLGQWFSLDVSIMGEISGDDLTTVQTRSVVMDGKKVADFCYSLKGTPCDNVTQRGVCIYTHAIRVLFPEDKMLFDMGMEGYVGIPIKNKADKVIGILCGLKRTPLNPEDSWENILTLLAAKAAVEIERRLMEEALIEGKEAAEAASHAKSSFLANMSHEIRTPLNGVIGALQLLQNGSLSKEHQEYIDAAVKSSSRLNRLLTDILDLSKVEAGKLALENKPFHLHRLIDDAIALFAPAASQIGLEFTSHVDSSIPPLLIGDDARLLQIFQNLLGNAFKFTAKGSIAIEAYSLPTHDNKKHKVCFSVSDTGEGISDDKMKFLFVPFTQASEGYARKHQGAGLGLHICKQLIELMGGNVSIESEKGVGTTIHFCILFDLPEHMPNEISSKSKQSLERSPYSLNILLVEDDSVNAMVISRILNKLGHLVDISVNGEEAIEHLRGNDFDLILMDVNMPVMDGVEATHAIRNGEAGHNKSQIPIVALTAFAMSGDKERFLGAGMNGYVSKPFDITQFNEVIGQYGKASGHKTRED